MTKISAKEIAALRAKTDLPMMEVKSALVEAGGDEAKAIEILKKKGLKKVQKKSDRETKSGLIETYTHDGKIGVMVEVNSETDFVAKNDQFKEFVHDLALHIAATNPKYLSKDDVPEDEVKNEMKDFVAQAEKEGKPEEIAKKIAEGKMKKYYEEVCLLEQIFIKDDKKTVSDLVTDLVAKIGENIQIARFVRFELGE